MRYVLQRLLFVLTVSWFLFCVGVVFLNERGIRFCDECELMPGLLLGLLMFLIPTAAVWALFYALVWAFLGSNSDDD